MPDPRSTGYFQATPNCFNETSAFIHSCNRCFLGVHGMTQAEAALFTAVSSDRASLMGEGDLSQNLDQGSSLKKPLTIRWAAEGHVWKGSASFQMSPL
jgi:hypothetical protein